MLVTIIASQYEEIVTTGSFSHSRHKPTDPSTPTTPSTTPTSPEVVLLLVLDVVLVVLSWSYLSLSPPGPTQLFYV